MKLSEAADGKSPKTINVSAEIERRQERLRDLTQAEAVLQARAEERYKVEKNKYEAKVAERAARQKQSGRKPRGPAPKPPLWLSTTKTSTISPTLSHGL